MGKILNARGEEAINILAELIDPASDIISDPAVIHGLQTGGSKRAAIQKILKDHKEAVIEMLAVDDGITPEEELSRITVITLPFRALAMLSNKEIQELLFGLAEMNKAATGSSAAFTNENE